MAKTYRIKKFSELTSVTVRSLQYYDEIDLLKPSARTESGHRLYSEKDMLRLQQIITLKFMGFSLKQIKDILTDNDFDMRRTLEIQATMLDEKTKTLEKATRLTRQANNMLESDGAVHWETIAKIIEVLDMKDVDVKTWAKSIFTEEEVQKFKEINEHYSESEREDYARRWRDLFNEVKQHLNEDPAGEVAQGLVARWMELVNMVYAGQPDMRRKLWENFKAGSWPKEMDYFDQDVIDYIDRASKFYKP